jgi:excisionase family DNA binding protein
MVRNTAARNLAAYEARREYMGTAEMAEYLGVSTDRVLALAKSGALRGYQKSEGGKYTFRRSEIEGKAVDDAPKLTAQQSVRLVAELTPEQMQALAMGEPVVIEIRRKAG